MSKSRRRAPKRKDKKVFTQTAKPVKAVNLGYSMMRGGIRF